MIQVMKVYCIRFFKQITWCSPECTRFYADSSQCVFFSLWRHIIHRENNSNSYLL